MSEWHNVRLNAAQRIYDNQTPEDGNNELPDELVEEYKDTQEFREWIMEDAGNGDWVAWEEANCDAIYDRAVEYWNDKYACASDDHADELRDRRKDGE